MANKQDNRPNVDHTNHSSDSESDSVDSSLSETAVQATTKAVLETQPESPTRDVSVRKEQRIATSRLRKDLKELKIFSSADFQSATINPSGDNLPEGRTNSPVQPSKLEPRNTSGSRARAQQSLREDSEVTKLRSEFEEFKRSVNSNHAEEVEHLRTSLIEMKSAYEEGISKLQSNLETSRSEFVEFKRSVHSNAEEVEDLQISLIEVKSAYEEAISKLQSNLETFQETVMGIVAAEREMRTNLIDMQSANAAERETLKKTMEDTMQQLLSLLAQQMKGMRIDTGSLPDDNFPSLWRDFLSQPVDNFKQGGFVYIDPRIISCKFSIGPSGKALVYVRESFEGLWKCIGGQADKLPASMTTAATTSIKGPDGNYLITGTPGTGKSCFAYYLLPHLLAKEGDSVLYQNCHKDMKFSVVIRRSKDSEFEVEHYRMPTNSLPKPMMGFLGKGKRVSCYIFDSGHKSGAKPESTDVPTIVISSPDCDQYKDFMQTCPMKFYMPTWEKEDIRTVVRQLYPHKSARMDDTIQRAKADYEEEVINNKEKKDRIDEAFQSFLEYDRADKVFSKHGGVIREVLNPYSEGRLKYLHDAVDGSNMEMVLLFLHKKGDVSSAVSHRVLHQKCEKKQETGLVDYENPVIAFASEYVAKRFWKSCLQNETAKRAICLLNLFGLMQGRLSKSFGKKFESLAHAIIKSESEENRTYTAKRLHHPENPDPSQEEEQNVKFNLKFKDQIENVEYEHVQQDECLNRPAKLTISRSDGEEEAYIIPRKACPAFDAFLPGSPQKILLQMTVSETHPIAAHELLSFLRSRGWNPEDISFVFVVLETKYSDFRYQKPRHALESDTEDYADFQKIRQYALPLPSPNWMYNVGGHRFAVGNRHYPLGSQAL